MSKPSTQQIISHLRGYVKHDEMIKLAADRLEEAEAAFTTLPSNIYAPDNVSWKTHSEEAQANADLNRAIEVIERVRANGFEQQLSKMRGFAQHKDDCIMSLSHHMSVGYKCTCGLQALLDKQP